MRRAGCVGVSNTMNAYPGPPTTTMVYTMAVATVAVAGAGEFDSARTGAPPEGWTCGVTAVERRNGQSKLTRRPPAGGKSRIELDDRHISGADAVGESKADGVTAFDDFTFGGQRVHGAGEGEG
jgi:hypothetical protein